MDQVLVKDSTATSVVADIVRIVRRLNDGTHWQRFQRIQPEAHNETR